MHSALGSVKQYYPHKVIWDRLLIPFLLYCMVYIYIDTTYLEVISQCIFSMITAPGSEGVKLVSHQMIPHRLERLKSTKFGEKIG